MLNRPREGQVVQQRGVFFIATEFTAFSARGEALWLTIICGHSAGKAGNLFR